MKIKVVIFSLFVFSFSWLTAQHLFSYTDLQQGVRVSRTMTIPEGWETSYSLAKAQKSIESLIRSDQFWRAADGSILINIVNYDNETETVEDIMEFDMKSYAEFRVGTIHISNTKKLFIDNDKSVAIVKIITGASDAPYQALAYVPERNTVLQVIFIAQTQQFFDEHYPAFEEFLKSYRYQAEILPTLSRDSYY